MVKEEIWSVSIERAQSFFRSQPDVTEENAHLFRFLSCRIHLTKLTPRGEGIWTANQTKLHLEGLDADVKSIYHRYFLHFLSAGG